MSAQEFDESQKGQFKKLTAELTRTTRIDSAVFYSFPYLFRRLSCPGCSQRVRSSAEYVFHSGSN